MELRFHFHTLSMNVLQEFPSNILSFCASLGESCEQTASESRDLMDASV